MVNVTVKFNNRDYILSCEDGQEQELEKLSLHLNEKFEQLKNDLGNIGESKLLLISSIQVIDEMFTIKESIEKLKNQNKNLLERFKEIKSLSILYKEDKEREIQNLQSELQELKSKIFDNEKNYSESLEKVSNSINNFLEKIN
jgi:cell division protein ZapA